MKKEVFKITRILSGVAILTLIVCAFMGVDLFEVGMGVSTLAAVVPGAALSTENSEAAKPGLHLDDIDEIVTKQWPAYAPLDQLFRTGIKGQRRKTESITCRNYAVETKPFEDVVTSAITAANQSAFDLPVANTDLYGVGDTLFINGVPGIKEGTADTQFANADLELVVTLVDGNNGLLKVMPVNGNGVTTTNKSLLVPGIQDIAQNDVISIGGRALSEFAVQTDPSQYVPEDDYNYCQFFGSQIEISKWEKKSLKEVKFTEMDQLELAMYDYRVKKEITYWKGSRNIGYPGGKKTYFMGGISNFVSNQVDWTSLLDGGKPIIQPGHIDEMVRQAFSGNSGSGQRWMFVGEYLWNALKRTEDIQKNISSKEVEYEYGLYFNKINTGDGELVLIKHPLFKFMGWGYDAVILDVNNLGERHFDAQSVADFDKKKLAQANSDAKFISETACLITKYPKTHTFIKGPVYTSLV